MPLGDPRPLRRRSHNPLSNRPKAGPGQKDSTASPHREPRTPSPDPLKVGKIVADCLEVTPRLMNPLEVIVGARTTHLAMRPGEDSAMLDILNREDGHKYQILVIRKPR